MLLSNLPITLPFMTGAILLSIIVWIYQRLFSRHSLPSNIPWAGVNGRGVLARGRATLRSLFDTRGLLEETYIKYSKNGIIFVLPNLLTGPEVILPQSMMDWLLQQPDDVLDQGEINRDFLQADYTMLHPKVVTDTVHKEVILKEFTRKLGEFTGDVNEEIDYAFRKAWGVDTKNWTMVTAYDTMSEVISRISNRVLVGLPLCRDEEYLYHSSRFARMVVLESAAISLCPNFLKPLIAPLVTFFDYQHYRGMLKYIMPIWRVRTSAPVHDDKQKSDYVQWCLNYANDERDPEERGSDMITKRLAAVSFAAIQSSVITACNLLLDLAAFDHTELLFEHMRHDIQAELEVENGAWTKNSLARLVILDSAIRESMRKGGFVSRGVLKKVMSKDGIKLPGFPSLVLPYGAKVGIHAYPIHYDDAIYPNAREYDPMRFCGGATIDVHDGNNVNKKGPSLVTTASDFMSFSHGRHACPGRFFAAQQLKLVLAYIATNYEIHKIDERPDNNWFVGSSGPSLDAKIMIRRREGTA